MIFHILKIGDIMETLIKINDVLWLLATILLIGGGIYFTIHLSGVQFKFKEMLQGFKTKTKETISPFKSLSMALAARIGVGSLAGIALAIHMGGVGTIFWIWISSLLTMPNTFAESVLAMKYREKDGSFHKGGPSFYMDRGLKKKKLAKIYACLILVAYLVGFLTIQANTISSSLFTSFSISPMLSGICIAGISAIIIWKGLKGISNATSKLVPIMGIGYLIISLFIVLQHMDLIPSLLMQIVHEAFRPQSITAGLLATIFIGMERGIFATESGLGSGAIASATTDSNNKIGQGMIQMFGIYFTVFIICTSTAFIILTSDYQPTMFADINGIEITQYALTYHLGTIGNILLTIFILFFAFSTILTGYYYGEVNLKYLMPKCSNRALTILKIITLLLLLWGSITSATLLWQVVDILVACLALINMYALIRLRKEVITEYYQSQKHLPMKKM